MQVQTILVGDVRPYHRNPREHTDESVESVKNSIIKFGFRVPIVLDEENTIITGHGRFKAVQSLEGELDERIEELREMDRDQLADNLEVVNDGRVFCIFETELDGRTADEYRISDNKIAEASEWDFDKLEDELEAIDTDDVVGYEPEDLDNLIADYEPPDPELEDEDDDPLTEDDTLGPTEDEAPTVELVCPECLESVEVDAEIAKREFEVMTE